jgi:hypothetical protein
VTAEDWKKTLGVKLPPIRVASGHLIVGPWFGVLNPGLEGRVDVQYKLTALRIGSVDCDPGDISGGRSFIPNWAVQGGGSGDRELPTTRISVEEAPGGSQTVSGTFEVRVEAAGRVITFTGNDTTQIVLPPRMAVIGRVMDPASRSKAQAATLTARH